MKVAIMKTWFVALLTILASSPAEAATLWASPGGGVTACTSGSPCNFVTLIATMVPGDIGMLNPGTYAADAIIQNKNGTAANRYTLRAVNPAVECPGTDPDDCVVANVASRSIFSGGGRALVVDNSDFWTIEGVQTRQFVCDNASNNGIFRFFHTYVDNGSIGPQGQTVQMNIGCANWLIENGYHTKLDDLGGDYGIIMFWTTNITIRNYYAGGGNHHHSVSIKRGGSGHIIDRLVCEGFEFQCVMVGQQEDDTINAAQSATACPNTPVDSCPGGPPCATNNISDQTSQNIVIRNVFGRNAFQAGLPGGGNPGIVAGRSGTRSVIMIGNARNVLIENVFAKVGNEPASKPFWIRNFGTTGGGTPGGRCGVERGNLVLRGLVIDAEDSAGGCIGISSMGENPSSITFDNMVCANAAINNDTGITWQATQLGNNAAAAWETQLRPAITIRNSVFFNCNSAWNDGHGAISLTQSNNNFSPNCGASKGGAGAQTVNPNLTGPIATPIPTLPASGHFDGKWAVGARLWDWAGVYQPIIERFNTNQAAFNNAGVGTTPPCVGNCDIGANEFFFVPLGPQWASCAAIDDGDPVQGGAEVPWVTGLGLTVDIDCTTKQIVIGACTDPLDGTTCNTTIYVRKTAYLQKKQLTEAVTLLSGASGSPADTSGQCWRTRATYTFTEALTDLTGIWVSIQQDPDGGAHNCAAPPQPSPYWSWQAHD